MDKVEIRKINEVYVKIVAEPSVKMEISEHFTFFVPGYKFIPSYRNKIWDGRIRLLNLMTGVIYAGLVPQIVDFCKKRGYSVALDDALHINNDIPEEIGYLLAQDLKASFLPRDYQNEAVRLALSQERVLLLSPTASGKSFTIYLIANYHRMEGRRVLIVVPTVGLVTQLASDFRDYNTNQGTSFTTHKIMQGVDKDMFVDFTISTWQSIYKMPASWFERFDVVIGDECHLFKAKSLSSIMEKLPHARYRIGLTGSLDDSQTNQTVLQGLFGQVRRVITTKELIDNKTLAEFDIKALVLNYSDKVRKENRGKTYQEEIDWIVSNETRNKYLAKMSTSLPGNVLILFQFVEKHGKVLEPLLKGRGKSVHFVHGGVSADERERIRNEVEKTTNNVILASYGTFSTGTNIVNLDYIIFASPSKSKIRNLQSIGRVLRRGKNKEKSTLFDIVDDLSWKGNRNFALKHFEERINIYDEESFDYKIYKIDLQE